MCIAILNLPQATPLTRETIFTCFENNGHGAGMAVAHKGKLLLFKEMTSKKAVWNQYQEWRSKYPKSPIMLHFRISTHGGTNLQNCHPFLVNKDLVFCHNGIIDIKCAAGCSDTATFNNEVLKKLPNGFLRNEAICDLIYSRIGASKLVFLHSNGDYDIIGEHRGHWHDGSWFSNHSYKPSRYYDYGGTRVLKNEYAATSFTKKVMPSAPVTGKKVSQPELPLPSNTYYDNGGYGGNYLSGYPMEDEREPNPHLCEECDAELTSDHVEQYWGVCTKCLSIYGVI